LDRSVLQKSHAKARVTSRNNFVSRIGMHQVPARNKF
jgi:hypothetical protein